MLFSFSVALTVMWTQKLHRTTGEEVRMTGEPGPKTKVPKVAWKHSFDYTIITSQP